jgi:hypothetical protein
MSIPVSSFQRLRKATSFVVSQMLTSSVGGVIKDPEKDPRLQNMETSSYVSAGWKNHEGFRNAYI